MTQADYAEKLDSKKVSSVSAPSLKEVKGAADALGWLSTKSRIYLASRVSFLNQQHQESLTVGTAKLVNSSIEHAMDFKDRCAVLNKMEMKSLFLAAYGDESLAGNSDLSSQMGGLICLREGLENFHPLGWFSEKCTIVVSSILAGEIIAFVTVYDLAFTIRNTLYELLGYELLLFLFTNSYSLFSTITEFQTIRKKRLSIDLAVLRQAYQRKEVTKFWICSNTIYAS